MPELLPPGYTLKVHESLPSTNDEARRLAEEDGAGTGTAVIALTQTAGRGRRGRSWISEPGNLFFSVFVRPERPSSEIATLSFVASLAVRDMLANWGDASKLSLKWPNDVLLTGRKVCGILLEGVTGESGIDGAIIGIGINLKHAPENVMFPAIALSDRVSSDVPELEAAAQELLARFDPWYRRWEEGGFDAIAEAWLSKAYRRGGQIAVNLTDREETGIFEGLDDTGALLLRKSGGEVLKISAGDVFFPQAGEGADHAADD